MSIKMQICETNNNVFKKLLETALLVVLIGVIPFFIIRYAKTHPKPEIANKETHRDYIWVESNELYLTYELPKRKRDWHKDWRLSVCGRKNQFGNKQIWLKLEAVYDMRDYFAFWGDSCNFHIYAVDIKKDYPYTVTKKAKLNTIADLYAVTASPDTVVVQSDENKILIFDDEYDGRHVLYYAYYPISAQQLQSLSELPLTHLTFQLPLSGLKGHTYAPANPNTMKRLLKMYNLVDKKLETYP